MAEWLIVLPALMVIAGLVAEVILFAVWVSRLTKHTTIVAANFCGFPAIGMGPAEAVAWYLVALVIPFSIPFVPHLIVKVWKTDAVRSWRTHVRLKALISLGGIVIYWGFTLSLCIMTEICIRQDPSDFARPDESQWTFGQILAVMLLFSVVVSVASHLSNLGSNT